MIRHVATLALLVITTVSTAQTTAIVGGTVHTVGPAGTLENATILIEDGVITAVGESVGAPSGARIINVAGKVVTPGLFTPFGHIGLVEVGFSAGPIDSVQRGDQFTASFDVADAFNRRSTLLAINRIEGVTRALAAPRAAGADGESQSSHVISGLAAVVNLGDGADSVDKRAAALVVNLGENGSGLAGESRASPLLVLRNALDEAVDYRVNRAAFERGQRRSYQHSVADLDALQGVLSGDVPLLANVERASDIEVLIRLCAEYGIRAIVNGGTEAWMLADELSAANIAVLTGPTANLPGDFDRLNARRDAATVLVAAGVTVGFAGPQSQTHNARNITQSAGNAVSEGLSWESALRAITLAPAEIFGVADRLGSIEVGKQADVVIWPDDPLELSNYPEQVFVRGDAVSMSSRQSMLRDRYLQSDSELPPAFRQ
jgi:imidazolonepropionase-like amidohydrolase